MTQSTTPRTDGARLTCTPLQRCLPREACAEPLLAVRRLRARTPHGGCVLFESGGTEGDSPRVAWTFVVARPLVRLELRDGEWTVEPLCDAGQAVASVLATRSDVTPRSMSSHDDGSRLRSASPLDFLRDAVSVLGDRSPAVLPPGLFGAIGYELVDHFENLGPRKPDPLDEPDASFVLAQDMVVYDHRRGVVHLVVRGLPFESQKDVALRLHELEQTVRGDEPMRLFAAREPRNGSSEFSDQDFLRAVRSVKDRIADGDLFQAVLSRRLIIPSDADPFAVYGALRQIEPSPYMFCLQLARGCLLGASPETFIRVDGGEVELRPIAGTAPRGRNADGQLDLERDGRLALMLQLDEKELAEHVMLLDLARNDVARVSVPGSTRVMEALTLEKYAAVQHLVSRVRGRLRDGFDAIHAYRAAANAGTLTGAPKPMAMRSIRELEPVARGFYGGAVGYLLADGRFDSCIAIRSMRHQDGRYLVQSGAGIVHDSDSDRELAETRHKARACLTALAMAEVQP